MNTVDSESSDHCHSTFGFYLKQTPEQFRTFLDGLLDRFSQWLLKNGRRLQIELDSSADRGWWPSQPLRAVLDVREKNLTYYLVKHDGKDGRSMHVHIMLPHRATELPQFLEDYLRYFEKTLKEHDWDRLDYH